MWAALSVLAATSAPAHALEHTAGLRYRHGWLPGGILNTWFFDSGDEGVEYDRPSVSADVFGLEYGLAIEPGGGPSFLFWIERMPFHMAEGYWDDKESPADHDDGDWLSPEKGLGMWTFGASYLHEVPITSDTKPVWVSFHAGGGLGLGVASGGITIWHPGFHEDVEDTSCLPEATAPQRYSTCAPDGTVDLPKIVPILDLTIGPKVHLTEHAMVRLDLGLHDVPYAGIAAGGVL
jgi:hypothetical protein